MLARVTAREREVTIRTALGASRARLARQLLTESAAVALAGGTAGLLLAVWGVQALRALGPGTIPRSEEVGIDPVALGFALGLSLVTGLLFGLLPALRVLGRDPHAGLQASGRGSTGGSGVRTTRGALVLAEVALAFMLLVGAALLLRSFNRLQEVDPGFTGEGILTARLSFPRNGYAEPERRLAFAERLMERLRAIPAIRGSPTGTRPTVPGPIPRGSRARTATATTRCSPGASTTAEASASGRLIYTTTAARLPLAEAGSGMCADAAERESPRLTSTAGSWPP